MIGQMSQNRIKMDIINIDINCAGFVQPPHCDTWALLRFYLLQQSIEMIIFYFLFNEISFVCALRSVRLLLLLLLPLLSVYVCDHL